jgi:hypothetical protein
MLQRLHDECANTEDTVLTLMLKLLTLSARGTMSVC